MGPFPLSSENVRCFLPKKCMKKHELSQHQSEPATLTDLLGSWKPPLISSPTAHLYALHHSVTGQLFYVGYTAKRPEERHREHLQGSHNEHVKEAVALHGTQVTMTSWFCVDERTWELEERRLVAHASFHGKVGNRHRGGGSEHDADVSRQSFSGYLDEGEHLVELEWCGISGNQRYWGFIFNHSTGTSYLKLDLYPTGTESKGEDEMRKANAERIRNTLSILPGVTPSNRHSHHLHGIRAIVRSWKTPWLGKGWIPNHQYDLVKVLPEWAPRIERLSSRQRMRKAWQGVRRS